MWAAAFFFQKISNRIQVLHLFLLLSLTLPPKVAFPIIRFEEGPDCQVRVEREAGAGIPIKSRNDAITPPSRKDVAAGGRGAQHLRPSQVFFFVHLAELATVLFVMIQKLLSRCKANLGANLGRG